jgi:polyisoprenoid-binding protein YceI
MSNLPPAGVYNVDPVHSNMTFVARHLVASKVRGSFKEFQGVITIGETAEASSVEGSVQAGSVTTNNDMRDAHLKTADFLDHENYPTLSLKSTEIRHKAGDQYIMDADLTIRGITKSVPFELEFLGSGPGMAPGVTVVGFEARAEVDRRDFNVNFQGTLENGSVVVGNKVVLELTVEAAKQD